MFVSEDQWVGFIRSFYGAPSDEWVHHVTFNWNTVLNQAGCGCTPTNMCTIWQDLMDARKESAMKALLESESVSLS